MSINAAKNPKTQRESLIAKIRKTIGIPNLAEKEIEKRALKFIGKAPEDNLTIKELDDYYRFCRLLYRTNKLLERDVSKHLFFSIIQDVKQIKEVESSIEKYWISFRMLIEIAVLIVFAPATASVVIYNRKKYVNAIKNIFKNNSGKGSDSKGNTKIIKLFEIAYKLLDEENLGEYLQNQAGIFDILSVYESFCIGSKNKEIKKVEAQISQILGQHKINKSMQTHVLELYDKLEKLHAEHKIYSNIIKQIKDVIQNKGLDKDSVKNLLASFKQILKEAVRNQDTDITQNLCSVVADAIISNTQNNLVDINTLKNLVTDFVVQNYDELKTLGAKLPELRKNVSRETLVSEFVNEGAELLFDIITFVGDKPELTKKIVKLIFESKNLGAKIQGKQAASNALNMAEALDVLRLILNEREKLTGMLTKERMSQLCKFIIEPQISELENKNFVITKDIQKNQQKIIALKFLRNILENHIQKVHSIFGSDTEKFINGIINEVNAQVQDVKAPKINMLNAVLKQLSTHGKNLNLVDKNNLGTLVKDIINDNIDLIEDSLGIKELGLDSAVFSSFLLHASADPELYDNLITKLSEITVYNSETKATHIDLDKVLNLVIYTNEFYKGKVDEEMHEQLLFEIKSISLNLIVKSEKARAYAKYIPNFFSLIDKLTNDSELVVELLSVTSTLQKAGAIETDISKLKFDLKNLSILQLIQESLSLQKSFEIFSIASKLTSTAATQLISLPRFNFLSENQQQEISNDFMMQVSKTHERLCSISEIKANMLNLYKEKPELYDQAEAGYFSNSQFNISLDFTKIDVDSNLTLHNCSFTRSVKLSDAVCQSGKLNFLNCDFTNLEIEISDASQIRNVISSIGSKDFTKLVEEGKIKILLKLKSSDKINDIRNILGVSRETNSGKIIDNFSILLLNGNVDFKGKLSKEQKRYITQQFIMAQANSPSDQYAVPTQTKQQYKQQFQHTAIDLQHYKLMQKIYSIYPSKIAEKHLTTLNEIIQKSDGLEILDNLYDIMVELNSNPELGIYTSDDILQVVFDEYLDRISIGEIEISALKSIELQDPYPSSLHHRLIQYGITDVKLRAHFYNNLINALEEVEHKEHFIDSVFDILKLDIEGLDNDIKLEIRTYIIASLAEGLSNNRDITINLIEGMLESEINKQINANKDNLMSGKITVYQLLNGIFQNVTNLSKASYSNIISQKYNLSVKESTSLGTFSTMMSGVTESAINTVSSGLESVISNIFSGHSRSD